MREQLGIVPGISDKTDHRIAEYEHYRWNVYMRSEGYVYRNNNGKKDEIAKTHQNLIPFYDLNDEEIKIWSLFVRKKIMRTMKYDFLKWIVSDNVFVSGIKIEHYRIFG